MKHASTPHKCAKDRHTSTARHLSKAGGVKDAIKPLPVISWRVSHLPLCVQKRFSVGKSPRVDPYEPLRDPVDQEVVAKRISKGNNRRRCPLNCGL
jgi:hypothetical protein